MSASHSGSNTFSPRALVLAWKRAYPAGSAVVMDDMTPDPHPIANGTRGALDVGGWSLSRSHPRRG